MASPAAIRTNHPVVAANLRSDRRATSKSPHGSRFCEVMYASAFDTLYWLNALSPSSSSHAIGIAHQITVCITSATMWSVVALFGFFVVWSGAGMTMSAASPFAVASQRYAEIGQIGYGSGEVVGGASTEVADRVRGTTSSDEARRVHVEEAQDALKTASWWSVIGLILGVIAAWSGAEMGARVLKRSEVATV